MHYYKTSNDLEIDFVVSYDNSIVELIQVSKSLKGVKTLNREIAPFLKAIDELKLKNTIKCTIITEDNSSMYENIKILNIKEFLMM